jgi:uncharacterized protein
MTRDEVEALVRVVADWATGREDIRALALVGSWARGEPRPDSDIDLLLVTDQADAYRQSRSWLESIDFGRIGHRVQSEAEAVYGVAWSSHVHLSPAADVEMTFVPRAWAAIDPIDGGTRRVVCDGLRIIFDRDGILARLAAAANSAVQ